MEARLGGKPLHFYGQAVSDLKVLDKRSMEWDLNNWKWDGDLFRATPLSNIPLDYNSRQLFPVGPENQKNVVLSNSSSNCSDDKCPGNEKGKREVDKRRRGGVREDGDLNDEAGSLNLMLGGQVYPIAEGEVKSGKKSKTVAPSVGSTSNRVVCQVEDCKVELNNAKDYHRRHKVCDMHSKATKALVGNVMQRFCQQCSRFHALPEFDEGKRSCRRRLAGHNRRRRKTHPENVVSGGSFNDEKGSGYLLISLLRILANMHSNGSEQTKDQVLFSHLLGNLASLAGTNNGTNIASLLQGSQGLLNGGASITTSEKLPPVVPNGSETTRVIRSPPKMDGGFNPKDLLRPTGQCSTLPTYDVPQNRSPDDSLSGLQSIAVFRSRDMLPAKANEIDVNSGRNRLNNIDLNNVYDDSQDYAEKMEVSRAPVNPGNRASDPPIWMQQDSYNTMTRVSGNSDSASTQSPSSSSGDAQSCTDRIVFKLFGKDPSDFPLLLRSQILDWLSHSPTDIESYIRPGCIILTVYLRLGKPTWEELCRDLGPSLRKLFDASNDTFWSSGWIYARVQHSVAFIYNGQVVLDTPLPLKSSKKCRIASIKPIAISRSDKAQFVVKGFHLLEPTTRLLCALEGEYLVQETCFNLMEGTDTVNGDNEIQCLKFACSVPNATGRGFIEVEDLGLSSSFFPYIVAEIEVCSEIRTLEPEIDAVEAIIDNEVESDKEAYNQALNFIHEMGWLLHRSHSKFRLGDTDSCFILFPFTRFTWLMEFSLDRSWCAVVKKLLGMLFDGVVDAGEHPSIEDALYEMGLLHQAVLRTSKPMVEFLLRYTSGKQKQQVDTGFLFRPDSLGPAGLTPLHVAASRDGCEIILDALTDDPGSVGIEAWKNARDNKGMTPYDYACIRGHYSYVHMIQKKINNKSERRHVVLDIPVTLSDPSNKRKIEDALKSTKVSSLQTEKTEIKAMAQRHCTLCNQKPVYGNRRSSLVYRPAMLSMVAIAAVCVCVALLFKSSPEVLYVFRPFRWEQLKYGTS